MTDTIKSGSTTGARQGEYPRPAASGGVVDTVKGTAKEVANAVGDAAGQAKDKAQEWSAAAVAQVRDTTQDLAAATADKATDLKQDLTQLVHRYPLQALMVGFGVGLLLGGLMDRATRS
jgi:ElaB/YqjD/DUF883 family membrane-anchored ribosome-binding protein